MKYYDIVLKHIANSVGLSAELLENYLYRTLKPTKKDVLHKSKIREIELRLTEGGLGVFYCLLWKSDHAPLRPSTVNDFIAQALQGVLEECVEQHYNLEYHVTHVALATEDYFRHILTQNPDAAVLLMIPQCADMLADVCVQMKRQCLIIDYQNEANKPVYTLNIDNYGAIVTITQKLIELGHKRIGFITGMMEHASARQRLEGYVAALEAAQIPYDKTLVKYGNWQITTAQTLTQELLIHQDRPTAIICSNDLSALGAYTAILSKGLRIPNDISVVGFDDIPFIATLNPCLTTVRQPLASMGRKAASILIEAMQGNSSREFRIEYPIEVMWRESICKVSEQDEPVRHNIKG